MSVWTAFPLRFIPELGWPCGRHVEQRAWSGSFDSAGSCRGANKAQENLWLRVFAGPFMMCGTTQKTNPSGETKETKSKWCGPSKRVVGGFDRSLKRSLHLETRDPYADR